MELSSLCSCHIGLCAAAILNFVQHLFILIHCTRCALHTKEKNQHCTVDRFKVSLCICQSSIVLFIDLKSFFVSIKYAWMLIDPADHYLCRNQKMTVGIPVRPGFFVEMKFQRKKGMHTNAQPHMRNKRCQRCGTLKFLRLPCWFLYYICIFSILHSLCPIHQRERSPLDCDLGVGTKSTSCSHVCVDVNWSSG